MIVLDLDPPNPGVLRRLLVLYRNQAVSFVSLIDREGRSLVKCGSFQVRKPDFYQTTLIFAFITILKKLLEIF
jgi:hypothetical protein